MRVHEEFACIGYFGFGNGIEFGRRAAREPVGQLVECATCPVASECWAKHRARVREIFPALVQIEDDIVATGLRGPEVVKTYARKLAEETLLETGKVLDQAKLTPPAINVMMGNMEDGCHVLAFGKPKDRGRLTLPYPFSQA